MDSILDKPIVLVCNQKWLGFAWKSPRQALTAMCGGMNGGTPPMLAMDIEMDEQGKVIHAIPTKWEDWLRLPVRGSDLILTCKTGQFRCPLVLICPAYAKIPTRGPNFSSEAIRRRDHDTCQVSGRKLAKGQGNLGHIVARAKGGKKTFDNIVYMDKDLNTLQGTRTPAEMGWALLKAPEAPKPVPATFIADENRHAHQKPFITR